MKKFFLGIGLLVAFASCKSDSKTTDLKFQLPQGQTYRYTADMKQTIAQTFMGQAMNTEQNMVFQTLYKVTGVEGDQRNVEVSYERIRMDTKAAGQEMRYDSRDTAGNHPMLAMVGGMIGRAFRMTVSPTGQIMKVDGFRELISAMMNNPADPNAAASRQQLETMFTDSSVRQMLSQTTEIYPDKPVQPGDTWTKTSITQTGPIALEIQNTYKLERATEQKAEVSMNSTITGKNAAGPGAIEGMTMKLNGKQTGKLDIEVATGLIENMDIDQDISGEMEIQGMKVPMTIKTVSHVKGEKVN